MLNEYYDGFRKNEKFPYEIIDKESNEFVGVFLIKLDLYDEDSFEFTIYIDEKFWNKGIYTEILPYMTEVAFNEIKTGNFRGFVMEKNIASRRASVWVSALEKDFLPSMEKSERTGSEESNAETSASRPRQ